MNFIVKMTTRIADLGTVCVSGIVGAINGQIVRIPGVKEILDEVSAAEMDVIRTGGDYFGAEALFQEARASSDKEIGPELASIMTTAWEELSAAQKRQKESMFLRILIRKVKSTACVGFHKFMRIVASKLFREEVGGLLCVLSVLMMVGLPKMAALIIVVTVTTSVVMEISKSDSASQHAL